MAKLHNYYVLCPLIDQKSFLGVSQDKNSENVIVTLGRNVVHKYRLSDQKQIGGWTSKDHITSAVIYNKEQDNYVGVFNNNTIKIWKEDSENLDKIKKYKFSLNILKLLQPENQSPLIIFSNGNCASLPYAIENRKSYENKSVLKDNDHIIDADCYKVNKTDHICYVVKKGSHHEIIYCPIREELGDLEKSKLVRLKISRTDDVHVVGELIRAQDFAVYVLWSDSKMTVYNLATKSSRTIGSVPWISTLTGTSLAWMGQNHLIIFGRKIDDDGAIIVAYNTSLGVGSCRYPMKMYTEGARLYCLHDRIILEASNHIGMLPYVLETDRNLSSLLGSHEIVVDETAEIVDWDTPIVPLYDVSDEIKDMLKLGLAERSICSQVLPPLLEKDDLKSVLRVAKIFKDMPESVLVQLMKYAIQLVNGHKLDVKNNEEFAEYCSGSNLSNKKDILMHKGRFEVLKYIFKIPFSDALLLPYLRNGLNLDDTLFLLTYINYLLMDPHDILSIEYERNLYDWCNLIMDAFYQQYLMTKDEKVTYVLENTLNMVVNLVDQLTQVDKVMPLIDRLLTRKVTTEAQESLSYKIDILNI